GDGAGAIGLSGEPAASKFDALLADYLRYLSVEKKASPHTVAAVRRECGAFLRYCAECRIEDARRVDVHTVRGFLARLNREGLQPPTLRRYLSCVRGMFRYGLRSGAV